MNDDTAIVCLVFLAVFETSPYFDKNLIRENHRYGSFPLVVMVVDRIALPHEQIVVESDL